MAESESKRPDVSPLVAGLAARCPRCGKGPLFSGYLAPAPRCASCGLDFSFIDSGDGPAVFVSLVGGLIVLGAALWAEVVFEPPLWVHMAIFLPLAVAVCLLLLRPFKGVLIALQYRNKAEEGRWEG
jgi:uncharacterized protein (DUF983 family)